MTFIVGIRKRTRSCSTELDDLKHRITMAINPVDRDMLIRVWEEVSYDINVARAAGGGHIEHL